MTDEAKPAARAIEELRAALDEGGNVKYIAEHTARALNAMAKVESDFQGECRRAVPFAQLYTVFMPDGSVQIRCTHKPAHVHEVS